MNRQEAVSLLDKTFNKGFDETNFISFVKEVFNNFLIKETNLGIWKEYKDYIESAKSFGIFRDKNGVIEVFVVKLKRTKSIERARTMQRNFIAKYLSAFEKDAALVAFYGDEPDDWRLSFVKMDYNLIKDEKGNVKGKKELTPAKRLSFLVGVNEPNHTCRSRFLDLIIEEKRNPTINEIETAFSIEKVTKEFFEKYKELYHKLKESLERLIEKDKFVKKEFEEKCIDIVDFSKKLLGQIVFIYFLQKKGWLGAEKDKPWGTGPKDFLRKLYSRKIIGYNNFFNDVLEPLFYEALAVQRNNDYFSRFNCKIPFLNGGLFEPINGYDWSGTEVLLENEIFKDIFDVFDLFNFTVKEDEPLEKEVAVDPEMLGKVFENLLDVKDRKSKGAFYTPREIVHYMCQQSLINYLETNTGIDRKDIEVFVQMSGFATAEDERNIEEIKRLQDELLTGSDNSAAEIEKEIKKYINNLTLPNSIYIQRDKIDKLLSEIKVVDPAVGSGAFLVGMMNEIVKARSILTIFFGKKNDKRTSYDLKRELIENCLYGVDIEPSAVEITKLRFWLSLIVDELDMQNIKPLPNLDHKIMCGNSLLEEFEGVKLFDERLLGEITKNNSIEIEELNNEIEKLSKEKCEITKGFKKDDERAKRIEIEIKRLQREKQKMVSGQEKETQQSTIIDSFSKRIQESRIKLKELRESYKKFFNEQNSHLKKKLKEQIDKLEWELIEETLKEQGNESAMEKLEQYKKNKAKPFFLWKLYFAEVFQRENPGFDVVIGNPPYVRQEMFTEIKEDLKKKFGEFFNGRADLYTYFYKQGVNLLKRGAVLSFISSNKFFVRGYGKNLRNYLTSEISLLEIINFGELPVFQAAVDSAIVIIKNAEHFSKQNVIAVQIKKESEIFDLVNTIRNKKVIIDILTLGSTEWVLQSSEKLNLFNKLKKNRITLKDYFNNNLFAGIKTGLDSAFVIDEKTKNSLIKEDPRSRDVIKPWLRGKDVRKWKADYIDLYVIYIPLNKVSIDDYSAVKNYLTQFKKQLEKRATSQKWFEMQQPQERFTKLFNSPKLIYPDCAKEMRVCYDTNNSYGTMAMYFMPYDPLIMGILNSKLFDWYARMTFATFGDPWKGGRIIFKTMYMREVPIEKNHVEIQKGVIGLVDQILSITKDEDYLKNPDKQAKVKKLEKEIDKLVYELYELTPEEIKIVEEAVK